MQYTLHRHIHLKIIISRIQYERKKWGDELTASLRSAVVRTGHAILEYLRFAKSVPTFYLSCNQKQESINPRARIECYRREHGESGKKGEGRSYSVVDTATSSVSVTIRKHRTFATRSVPNGVEALHSVVTTSIRLLAFVDICFSPLR